MMPINYNNPNLDFSAEEAILKEKLLRAAEMQGANKGTLLGYGGMVAPWKAGTGLGNSMTQMSGDIRTQRANDEQRQLGQEQQDRLSALRGQITPTAPVNLNDPQAMMNEAARLQQLGGQMSQLPMGAQEGQALIDANSSFPTTSMGKAQSNNYNVQTATTADDRKVKAAQVDQGYNLAQKDRDLRNDIMLRQWDLDNPDPTKLSGGSGGSSGSGGSGRAKDDADFRRNLADRAEMARSLFTYREGEGFKATTEGVSSWIGDVVGDKVKYLGMGDTASGLNQLSNMKGKITKLAKKLMSEEGKLGNMAVQEWAIITDAIAKLDPVTNNFEEVLAEIETVINESHRRNVQDYANKYGVSFEDAYKQFGTPESEARRTMADRDAILEKSTTKPTAERRVIKLPDGTYGYEQD